MKPLFEELEEARFTFLEMDAAYSDGLEDAYDKIINLIQQSDFTIGLEELVTFAENEKGYTFEPPHAHNVGHDVFDPVRFQERVRTLRESEADHYTPEVP